MPALAATVVILPRRIICVNWDFSVCAESLFVLRCSFFVKVCGLSDAIYIWRSACRWAETDAVSGVSLTTTCPDRVSFEISGCGKAASFRPQFLYSAFGPHLFSMQIPHIYSLPHRRQYLPDIPDHPEIIPDIPETEVFPL